MPSAAESPGGPCPRTAPGVGADGGWWSWDGLRRTVASRPRTWGRCVAAGDRGRRGSLRHGCDGRLTADKLHLHPNSVDYRLARLAGACGFDANDPAQRALAHTALCVRAVARHRTGRRTQATLRLRS
ncbi:helix-turn-helix domain-containing protein [Streptomyces sp. NPDC006446]|uniref:helix-turn-helix domain-containing protein n=1 Tax=Streptomyces sp. NPDC006446 TaxID=3154301 RepID=UPI0033BCFF33